MQATEQWQMDLMRQCNFISVEKTPTSASGE